MSASCAPRSPRRRSLTSGGDLDTHMNKKSSDCMCRRIGFLFRVYFILAIASRFLEPAGEPASGAGRARAAARTSEQFHCGSLNNW